MGMMGMQIQYSSVCHCRPRNVISLLPPTSSSLLSKHNKNINPNHQQVSLFSSKYSPASNNHSHSNDHDPFSRTSCSYKRRPLLPFTFNNGNKLDAAAAASASASGNNNVIWSPDKTTPSPSLSDILWPSLGGFAAMAMLGKIDQMLAPKGMAITIAPLGAVCAVLFVTPNAPAARKYNMFMAQIGCAAIGVLAFTILGPGWLARSAALAASLAFMIYTKSTHPPAASLPLVFIDGAKFHGLNYWYALFPGAAGCIVLSLIQEVVYYLKENFKF